MWIASCQVPAENPICWPRTEVMAAVQDTPYMFLCPFHLRGCVYSEIEGHDVLQSNTHTMEEIHGTMGSTASPTRSPWELNGHVSVGGISDGVGRNQYVTRNILRIARLDLEAARYKCIFWATERVPLTIMGTALCLRGGYAHPVSWSSHAYGYENASIVTAPLRRNFGCTSREIVWTSNLECHAVSQRPGN